jgi:hypothetical protein
MIAAQDVDRALELIGEVAQQLHTSRSEAR